MTSAGLDNDSAARREALDTRRSFIVQAPAGSGKTELLIQRHLALLAIADAPEEVVAITFTRKATGEMRGRMLEALARVGEPPPQDAHARQTWALARAVAARDRDRGWRLKDNPARLRIHTIDGLCARLARQMPWLSRFGAEAAPVEDAAPLYREAARRTRALLEEDENLAGPVARLLDHLDNDLARFESMLESMLSRRDQWLKFLAGGSPDEAGLRAELEAALERAVAAALEQAQAATPPALADDLLAVARYAGANLRAGHPEAKLARLAEYDALPAPVPAELEAWQGLAELLLTKSGSLRKRPDKSIGIPPDKHPKARAMKDRATALLAALSGEARFINALAAARSLPPPAYTDAQWSVLTALLQVLRLAAGLLRLVFADAGRVDFIELLSAARLALGEEDAPTDLALSLDYRIDQILVDEFQDTSHSQFQLLNLLTAGWTPEDGRTLFLVGDPMQSIYRFREADVGVFLRAWRHGFRTVRLERLSLRANFRSAGAIVRWVNEAFPQVFPAGDDESSGAVAFRPAVAAGGGDDAGAVQVHAVVDGDEDEEAEQVVDCVRQSLTREPEGSVAILVRSRSHLRAILPRLGAAGIAYRGVELRSVLTTPAVHDLLSLTRALIHPADRVAWLALLRAPWCGLSLEDLTALAGGDDARPVAELLADETLVSSLSPDGRARLERTARVLLRALGERGRRSLRRQVEGVWQALGGPACIEPAALDDAGVCLDLIESFESEQRVVDVDGLTDRLADLYAAPPSDAARVEVMTIHKAKGLEFDTVIVPGLGRTPPAEGRRLLAWTQRAAGPAGTDLLLAPLPRDDADEPPVYEHLKRAEDAKHELEATRLLYVAATRARRRLHLLGAARRSDDGDGLRSPPRRALLGHLWPVVKTAFEAAAAESSARAPVSPAGELPRPGIRRVPAGWVPPPPAPAVSFTPPFLVTQDAAPAEPVLFEWAGFSVRHIGTVVHGALRRIAEDGPARWDQTRVHGLEPRLRRALAAQGLPGEELDEGVARTLEAIVRVLADPTGRWILSEAHAEAQNELALSGMLDGRLIHARVDRAFVDEEGVRWIVDYKSGRHEGGSAETFLNRERERYAPQMERYARLMAALDRRPIRVGLYFPLLNGWRAWAPQSGGRT